MPHTYYFIVNEDSLNKHGDDLRDAGYAAELSDLKLRQELRAMGYAPTGQFLTRWVRGDDALYITSREFDPYEQKWVS